MRVRIVDAAADIRGFLAAVLESDTGASVTEAGSGAAGMARLAREEFDADRPHRP